LQTMTVADLEGYLGSAIVVRTAIEWLEDGTERVTIIIFDKFEHDEGWEVSGRVQFFWEEGYLCYAGFTEIPSPWAGDKRQEVLSRMIQELGWVCPAWTEGHPWATREMPSNDKLDPACFSLLPHYARLEACLYGLATSPSFTYHQQQVLWTMVNRFGGFHKRMRNDWMKKMK
jgi:hypothetical protein